MVKRVHHPHVLQRMNDIRLYLRVTKLSNIATPSGTGIKEEIFQGIPQTSSLTEWPHRRKPLQENLNTWKKILTSMFKSATGLHPKNLGASLSTPLPILANLTSFQTYIQSLPLYHKILLGNFNPSLLDLSHIVNWLKHGTLYGGSNRSVDDGIGAHSFCFCNGQHKSQIIGGLAPTPGNQQELTSLRAELCGAISLVLVINGIVQVYNLHSPLCNVLDR